jgi:hypothetical protein
MSEERGTPRGHPRPVGEICGASMRRPHPFSGKAENESKALPPLSGGELLISCIPDPVDFFR